MELPAFFEQLKERYSFDGAQRIEMIWRRQENLPLLKTDGQKLHCVLKSLIDNAVKFTPKGRVIVSVRMNDHCDGHPDLVDSHGGETARLRTIEFDVQDSGIGIREEDMAQLFKIFRQVDSSAQRAYEGAGLGLYIAKKYCDLLGATIAVRSTVGKGSTFTVTLPAQEVR